jgi:hypothetical protein
MFEPADDGSRVFDGSFLEAEHMGADMKLKNTGLFVLLVVLDITAIQVFRYFTPMIIPLRLGFYFAVIAFSLFLFFHISKPKNPVKTGLVLSFVCFTVALLESFTVHVLIGHESYRPIFLLPCGFALTLPLIVGVIYQLTKNRK